MTLLAPSPAQSERDRIAALDYATVARIHADSPSEAFAEELERRDADMDGAFREGIREIDDAQLFEALRYPRLAKIAREELDHRRRYERANSGTWRSGPDAPVPYPPAGYERFRNGSQGGSRIRVPKKRKQGRRSWR